MKEEWREVPDTNGDYFISTTGNFKSIDRFDSIGRWISGKVFIGNAAGKDGRYRKVTIHRDGKKTHRNVHKVMAEVFLGHRSDDGMIVHHKNNIGSDNRLCNLELITQRDNLFTHNGKRKSKYQGVHFNVLAGKWRSAIYLDKKQVHLGTFDTEYDAHLAYQKALKQVI